MLDHPRVRFFASWRRAFWTFVPEKATAKAADSSPSTSSGCFFTKWPMTRRMASGTRLSQCTGTMIPGA